jgi:hypothetical protein
MISRILHESAYYPEHAPRVEQTAYHTIHRRLVIEEDQPCWICGIRYSQGAKNETHHFHLEWALANAADAEKLHADYSDVPLNDEKALLDWIDHSEENLLVLCPDHHRHKLLGIHMITHPDWMAQKYLSDDFLKAWKEQESDYSPH